MIFNFNYITGTVSQYEYSTPEQSCLPPAVFAGQTRLLWSDSTVVLLYVSYCIIYYD
jgi:hypothetical protein